MFSLFLCPVYGENTKKTKIHEVNEKFYFYFLYITFGLIYKIGQNLLLKKFVQYGF